MSIWYITPSIRPAASAYPIFNMWKQQGYKVAILRQGEPIHADLTIQTGEYLGLPRSINALVRAVLLLDPDVEWFVHGGDDYQPDLNRTAESIGRECNDYFRGTFGVMQPTGDRWNEGSIDTAAASAWMGREWCERINQGLGPGWEEYRHYYWDTELQGVAQYRGVFWQRRDIIQLHMHWSRSGEEECPEHLTELWNSPRYWADKGIYEDRKRLKFPGHAPLEINRAGVGR